ncbi:transcription termination factor 5, mitochondrial-like [Epargyreus clarus]|uniref:transcription termination factor 5, mitochondrial-like n=1 Tax=Epargyreus clarus TaxID=520877 RepID=UPI003C2F8732
MRINRRSFPLLFKHCLPCLNYCAIRRLHEIPFFDLYHRITGKTIPKSSLPKLKKKHPNLDTVSREQLQSTLQILQKFGITPLEACENPHLFSMNPISMDNYGEILKECGFLTIAPTHIIRYHTLVRARTISQLKKEGLIDSNLKLDNVLHDCFPEWPEKEKKYQPFPDSSTSILTIRVYVLEQYLNWRLSVTTDEFKKYCRNYLPLKHRPMCDIKEALNLAQNEIKFDVPCIRRNGFIIASDPVNTKLILEKVESLAGIDIREAIRIEPAILKNNYNSLLEIKQILEDFNIKNEAQRHCMRVYCMAPESVRERLQHLSTLKEYRVLFSNPRVLSLVVHKVKVLNRLEKIQEAKKQCYSLNHLVGSNQIFNSYINSFGNKACGRDIAVLISSSLDADKIKTYDRNGNTKLSQSELTELILPKLRKHKYWLHTALNAIDENIQYLKQFFDDNVIYHNCLLLLYPVAEIKQYIELLLKKRDKYRRYDDVCNIQLDPVYNMLNYDLLTDHQVLSLVLYEMEKKHHFTGDGVWNKANKTESEDFNLPIQQIV